MVGEERRIVRFGDWYDYDGMKRQWSLYEALLGFCIFLAVMTILIIPDRKLGDIVLLYQASVAS
jgi:hypothetical protein